MIIDHGDGENDVKHQVICVMFASALALHVLHPPDPHLVLHRPHLHLVNCKFLFSSHKVRLVTQDYLRKCGHRLEVLHNLCPLLRLLFGIAETTWWTFPWTQVLQVEDFNKAAGHPVLTLQPVQLVEIFLEDLWQAADIKPFPQHHLHCRLQSLNFSILMQSLYLAGCCSEGECRVQCDDTSHPL